MRNSKQETIADIVADIRAQNQGLPEDSYALSPLVCDLLSFADRIEAAHQREVAELKSKVAELRECLKDAVLYNCAICDSKGKSCEVKGFCLEQRWRKVLKGASND